MTDRTYCLNCANLRSSMFDVERCFVSRMSFIDPNDESECLPKSFFVHNEIRSCFEMNVDFSFGLAV